MTMERHAGTVPFGREPGSDRRIAALDGLRGIAILLVLISHASNAGMNVVPGFSMSGAGKFGVWLFFVLSAFLLTGQLLALDMRRTLDRRAWAGYALRRVLRIYPMYTVFLFVTLLLSGAGLPPGFSASDVLRHLVLQAGAGHLWSIPVEFKYYMALPLVIAVYVFVCRRSIAAASVLTVIAVAVHSLLLPSPGNDIALLKYIPVFLIGSWIAVLASRIGFRDGAILPKLSPWLCAMALGLMCLVLLMTPSVWGKLVGPPVSSTHWRESYALFGMIWAAFILCVLGGGAWAERIFASAPLRFCGAVSFSAYLWHPMLIDWVSRWSKSTPAFQAVEVVAATLLLATVSHLLIEKPCMRLAKILTEKRDGLTAAVESPRGSRIGIE